jgi:hypothetical protein
MEARGMAEDNVGPDKRQLAAWLVGFQECEVEASTKNLHLGTLDGRHVPSTKGFSCHHLQREEPHSV